MPWWLLPLLCGVLVSTVAQNVTELPEECFAPNGTVRYASVGDPGELPRENATSGCEELSRGDGARWNLVTILSRDELNTLIPLVNDTEACGVLPGDRFWTGASWNGSFFVWEDGTTLDETVGTGAAWVERIDVRRQPDEECVQLAEFCWVEWYLITEPPTQALTPAPTLVLTLAPTPVNGTAANVTLPEAGLGGGTEAEPGAGIGNSTAVNATMPPLNPNVTEPGVVMNYTVTICLYGLEAAVCPDTSRGVVGLCELADQGECAFYDCPTLYEKNETLAAATCLLEVCTREECCQRKGVSMLAGERTAFVVTCLVLGAIFVSFGLLMFVKRKEWDWRYILCEVLLDRYTIAGVFLALLLLVTVLQTINTGINSSWLFPICLLFIIIYVAIMTIHVWGRFHPRPVEDEPTHEVHELESIPSPLRNGPIAGRTTDINPRQENGPIIWSPSRRSPDHTPERFRGRSTGQRPQRTNRGMQGQQLELQQQQQQTSERVRDSGGVAW
ncbi:unnamed protein product, partial [Discosporangium mesarthrocarpum]